MFAGDLEPAQVVSLAQSFAGRRFDGARLILIFPSDITMSSEERAAADAVITGPHAPSPIGLFVALPITGIEDVRRLGVLGASPHAIEAGHRAGAGAIIGLAENQEARRS